MANCGFPRQRLREWLAGHEQAFQHFGGVTDTMVVDNAKAKRGQFH